MSLLVIITRRSSSCNASPVLRCAQLRAFIPQHSSWFFRSTADARRWEHPRIIYIYIYMILERWAFEVKQTMPSNSSGFGWGPCPVRLCRPREVKTRFGQIRPSGWKYQTCNLFLVFIGDISLHQKPPRSVLRAKQRRHDVNHAVRRWTLPPLTRLADRINLMYLYSFPSPRTVKLCRLMLTHSSVFH